MKIKKIVAFAACAITALTATACVRPTTDDNTGDKIRMFIIEGNYYDGAEKDTVWKQIESNTNSNISIEGAINNEDYYTTLSPMLNTGDYPDVFFSVPGGTNGAYDDWADPEDGILWNLDELFAMYPGEYPTLEAYVNSTQYKNIQFNGQHTLIPYTSSASGWGIYYREDWLKKVGEKDGDGNAVVPKTLEDFERVMYKFTFDDPDGNGANDTYGMSPGNLAHYFQVFLHAFGGCTDWDLDSSNKLEFMYTSEAAKNCLTWLNKLYSDGVIDPQFNTNNNDSDRQDFENSRSGCIVTNAEGHVAWVAEPVCKLQGYDGIVCMGPAPLGTGKAGSKSNIVLGVEGKGGFSNWGGWWGGYSITKACKNTKAVLRLFEYLMSKEGCELRTYGIKDVHYTLDDKGAVVPNLENRSKEPDGRFTALTVEDGSKQPAGSYKLGSLIAPNINWNNSESGKNYSVLQDYRSFSAKLYYLADDADRLRTLYDTRLVNVTAYPTNVAKMMTKVQDESSTYFIQAIMGKKNLTSDWTTMLANCDSLGWKTIEGAVDEVARNLGIIK